MIYRNLIIFILSLHAFCSLPVFAAQTANDYYEDAVIRFNQKDYKGAIIQLKNVLQQQADMIPAHLLMGKAYLLDGDPAAAAVKQILFAQWRQNEKYHTVNGLAGKASR